MYKFQYVILLCLLALLLGGCDHDVSSGYNFSTFAGTIWKTKVPVALIQEGNVVVGNDCTQKDELSFAGGPAYWQEYDGLYRIAAILPPGTSIRIDRLMEKGNDAGGLYVEATVQSGPEKGKVIRASRRLFAYNSFLNPGDRAAPDTWGPAPDKLEK
jgi:hypothetical protein